MRSPAPLSLLVLAAACGPSTPGPQPVAPKPVEVAPVGPSIVSPARWRLDPTGASIATKLEVEGGTLWIGTAGERWLAPKKGELVAADTILNGPIVGALRDEASGLAFVSEDGSVSVVKEPLGPVVEMRAPKTALRSVAVGRQAIVGIARNGLQRSTDGGRTFAPVALPATKGTLAQVAMLPSGEGLLLVAPQRVLATTDDGATWEPVVTPGIGARQVLVDANGDLVLEGLIASAVLRTGPLRLERVAKAPAVGLELPVAESRTELLGAEAVWAGVAALDGEHWAEAFPDAEDPERWSIAIGELGKPPVTKRLEVERCERVYVAMRWPTILVGCNSQAVVSPTIGSAASPWTPSKPLRYELRLLRSDDGGKTFKDDGAIASNDREKHLWLGPDGLLLVDGACKRSRSDYDCGDSPPVVRLPGAKSVAKAVDGFGARFDRVAFGAGGRAWALGTDSSGRSAIWVSSNGGRHFTRRPLPPGLDEKGKLVAPSFEGASLSIDDAGNAIALLHADPGRLLRYVVTPEGVSASPQIVQLEVDGFDLHGRFGFAYALPASAWETSDHGATWRRVTAPALGSSGALERSVACSAAGCLVGARASRVGWDLGKGAPPTEAASPEPQLAYRTPLRCTTEGAWQELGLSGLPGVGNVDLGGKSRWVVAKRDPAKGSMTAVVASPGPKGIEVKEVSLFGPQPVDSAGAVVMQLEGVAALRYSFKRNPQPATPPPIGVPPKPGVGVISKPVSLPVTSIAPQQIVDVDVAWYVAETGKVHRATIKAAGALDPIKDVFDNRTTPSQARTGLLSIAHGGIHVRPFASAGAEAPLYFVSESGKVEKLAWPELPRTDVRGKTMGLRLDAARIGGRSLVFGDVGGGVQLLLAPSPGGADSSPRAWGLWPSSTDGDAQLRFVDSGASPMLGILWSGDRTTPAAGWVVPLQIGKNDPEVVAALPTAAALEDPPTPCGAAPGPLRVTLPWTPGTRRPVIVSGEGNDLVLASSASLVRSGSDGTTCVRAIDAFETSWRSGGSYGAIVSIDDLERSALFRTTSKPSVGTELSYRPMRCTFEKGPLPEALHSVPGFKR